MPLTTWAPTTRAWRSGDRAIEAHPGVKTLYARRLIRGKRWLLLRSWANLDEDDRTTLTQLLARNRRLAKAYLLKEQLGQLDQVADRPRDDVVVRLEVSLVLLEAAAERARIVLCHGRLFGDDKLFSHVGAAG